MSCVSISGVPILHKQRGIIRDFRFACPRWPLYTPEGRPAPEILFVAQASSSRDCQLSPR